MSGIERGRRRLTFEAPPTPPPVSGWDGGPLTFQFPDRAPNTINLSELRVTKIASPMVAALQELASMPGGPIGSRGSVLNAARAIRLFDQFLTEAKLLPATAGVDRVTSSMVDRFETWTRAMYAIHSSMPYQHISNLIVLLRQVARTHPVDSGLIQRLRYVANGPLGIKRPLDAYGDAILRQLRRACKRDISKTVHRITVEGESALAAGTDPDVGGWNNFENLVWQAANRGVLSRDMLDANGARPGWFSGCGALNLTRARNLVHPTQRDLVPFVILLILESGLEIECVRQLRRDCLTNPTDSGFVDIRYVKRRAQGAEHKTLRVRDGGRFTPGGLIRTVMRLTHRGAGILGSDRLLVHYGKAGLAESRLQLNRSRRTSCPAAQFLSDYEIVDDAGEPLSMDFRRLRKSHKQARYHELG